MSVFGRSQSGVTFNWQGEKKILALLKRLPAKDVKAAARVGCREAAKIFTEAAKKTAPEDTGHLKRHIKTRAMKRKGRAGRKGVGMESRLEFGSFYGAFQEWGWKTRGGRKIEGQLFMTEAFIMNHDRARRRAFVTIRRELERRALR